MRCKYIWPANNVCDHENNPENDKIFRPEPARIAVNFLLSRGWLQGQDIHLNLVTFMTLEVRQTNMAAVSSDFSVTCR